MRYVVKAELFGSLVRGDDTPDSDVDLLVVYDNSRPKGFRSFAIFDDIETALGRRVDIVQEHLLHDCLLKVCTSSPASTRAGRCRAVPAMPEYLRKMSAISRCFSKRYYKSTGKTGGFFVQNHCCPYTDNNGAK